MSDKFLSRRAALRVAACGGLAAGLLFVPGQAAWATEDKEEDIDLDKVPAKIMAAAKKAAPKVEWTSATKVTDEDEDVYYNLEGADAKKRDVWIEVDDEGAIEELQVVIDEKDVPKVVSDALKAKLAKFTVTCVSEVHDDGKLNGKVTQYDYEGNRPKDKESIIVSVSADGKTVEVDV